MMTHRYYFSQKLEDVQNFWETKIEFNTTPPFQTQFEGFSGVIDTAELDGAIQIDPHNVCLNCVGGKGIFWVKPTLRGLYSLNSCSFTHQSTRNLILNSKMFSKLISAHACWRNFIFKTFAWADPKIYTVKMFMLKFCVDLYAYCICLIIVWVKGPIFVKLVAWLVTYDSKLFLRILNSRIP